MCGGGLLAGIGIPMWIIGNNRKSQIEVALVKFQSTSYVMPSGTSYVMPPGIGLKIKF